MAFDIGPRIGIEGEAEFRRGIQDINGNLKTLKTEMQAVTSAYDQNEQSVEALSAKSQVLTKTVDAQRSKLAELQKGLAASSEKYGENDRTTQGWQQAVNAATAELNKMERELHTTESALGNLNEEAKQKALAEYSEQAALLGDRLRNGLDRALNISMAGIAALSGAAIAGTKALIDLAGASGEFADDVMTTAAQTGLTVQKLQELDYAMRFIDTEVEVYTGSMAKMIKNMATAAKGTGDAAAAFRTLKVDIRDSVTGELRDSQTVFGETIDALGRMENETQRDALAMQIFGKSAQALNPLIKAGGAALAEYSQEARDLGLVLSDEAVASLGEYDDVMQRVSAQTQVLGRQVALNVINPMKQSGNVVSDAINKISKSLQSGALKSAMTKIGDSAAKLVVKGAELADKVIPKVADGIEFLVDNGGKLLAGLVAVTAATGTLKAAMAIHATIKAAAAGWAAYTAAQVAATTATSAATVATTGLNAVLAANPIMAVIMLVAALAAGVGAYAIATGGASSKTKELEESTKALQTELDNTAQAHQDAIKGIEDQAATADVLIDKIDELAKKEGKTAGEKATLLGLIEELNEQVPDLNLAYDDQTNSLNMTASAVRAMVKAQMEAARQTQNIERLKTLYTQQATISNDLAQKQKMLEQATAEYNEVLERKNQNESQRAYAEMGAYNRLQDHTEAVNAAKQAQFENNLEIVKTEEVVNAAAAATEAATEATKASTEATTENTKLTEEQMEQLEARYKTYAENTQSLFSTLAEKVADSTAKSVSALTQSLIDNQTVVEKWADNLNTLAGRGVDEGIIQQLREAGPEAAKQVQALVDASDEELKKLNSAFQKGADVATNTFMTAIGVTDFLNAGTKAIDDIASRVTQNTALSSATQRQIVDAFSTMQREISTQNFPTLGQQIADGIINGINSRTASGATAMGGFVKSLLSAAKKAAEIKSPSKLFKRELGAYMGQGAVEGMTESIRNSGMAVRQAMQSLTTNNISSPQYNNNFGGLSVTVLGNADRESAGTIGREAGDRLGMKLRWKGVNP